jgi:hypothetical protein
MVVGPDMSSGGWADEDTEESRVRRIREEEERKAIERMAGGKNMLKTEKIEGMDEGVVGIEWVRKTLEGKVRRNKQTRDIATHERITEIILTRNTYPPHTP